MTTSRRSVGRSSSSCYREQQPTDIPVELKAVVQRFEIETFDESGFEDLLRTLTNRPAFVPPPVGSLPLLPPKSVGAGPRTDTKYAMADAILTLPEREKLAVALTYYERLTRDEIAEILGGSPNDVSWLVQTATSRLGDVVLRDLTADEGGNVGQRHTAHTALLADGPHEGERVKIEPGQTALMLSERFDLDQGHADAIDHYIYEGPTGNDRSTVTFTFSHQEHRVTTDGLTVLRRSPLMRSRPYPPCCRSQWPGAPPGHVLRNRHLDVPP
jgi:Sigma-70, region 4